MEINKSSLNVAVQSSSKQCDDDNADHAVILYPFQNCKSWNSLNETNKSYHESFSSLFEFVFGHIWVTIRVNYHQPGKSFAYTRQVEVNSIQIYLYLFVENEKTSEKKFVSKISSLNKHLDHFLLEKLLFRLLSKMNSLLSLVIFFQ